MNTSYINGTYFNNYSLECINQSIPDASSGAMSTINYVIGNFIYPVVLCIGILGNLLNIVVILSQRMSMRFTAITILSVAVVDTVGLLVWLLPEYLDILSGYDVRESSQTACTLFTFFTVVCTVASPWCLVALTTERMVSVIWPFKVKLIFTRKSSLFVQLSIYVVSIAFAAFSSQHVDISKTNADVYGGTACGIVPDSLYVFSYTISILFLSLTFPIPSILLFMSNFAIVYNMKPIKNIALPTEISLRLHQQRIRMFKLVTVLNVVFFISQFPLTTYASVTEYFRDWIKSAVCTDDILFRKNVTKTISTCCTCFASINPSINVLLYFSISDRFRGACKALFRCEAAGTRNVFGD